MGVNIKIPGSGKGKTAYQKSKDRERFRRRASIEPIGHLKQDHRLFRNYLKGIEGDMINTLLAGAAFNMMKMLRKIRGSILCALNDIVKILTQEYQSLINYC
jgi:IS5 family transposase